MSRDYRLSLDDIYESCEKILRYVRGMDFEQFEAEILAAAQIMIIRFLATNYHERTRID